MRQFKPVPYGESSFAKLRGRGCVYVDKTRFIQTIEEDDARYFLLVRPRRFGKSVFANMLQAYYDKAAKEDFAKNFEGTWIGAHPTAFASQYLVLKLDFSGIRGSGSDLATNFMLKVKKGMRQFARRYFSENTEVEAVLKGVYSEPSALITDFLSVVEYLTDAKLYVIIDEYDQFAQEVLATDITKFREMTGNEGFLKAFYAVLKNFTQSCIDRVFITGVTSISLDSMTTGFNIAKNRSMSPTFATMLGFDDEELRKLIPQIVDVKRYGHSVDEIFERMKVLYDGYRFSPKSEATVFNASMCLYYLSEIAESNEEPDTLLDPSFSVDTSKINGILSLCKDRAFVERIVWDILFDRPVKSLGVSLAINLNAAQGLSNRDALTALLFMGLLTFSAENTDQLVCPNRAVKQLFFQYWFCKEASEQDITFSTESQKQSIDALRRGDARPLLMSVSEVLSNAVGVHVRAHLNEVAIRLAVNMAVNTNSVYKVTAEEEALGAGFTDLVLRPNAHHPEAVGWVMEFKYLKKSDATSAAIEKKLAEAEAQLLRYAKAENIASIPHLHRAAVVFSGTELKGLKVF